MNESWKIVPMGAVQKSPTKRPATGKYSQIVTALKGLKEDEVIEVATNDKKHLAAFRKQIRKVAKTKTNRSVLSSCDMDGKTLWLWMEPELTVRPLQAESTFVSAGIF